MKIALLAARNSIHTVRWANGLAARGYKVHLITAHHGGDKLDDRVQVYPLLFRAPVGYYLNVVHFKMLLRKIQPDILHAHYASGYGTLGRLSRFHPYILSVWGSDVYDFPLKSPVNRWIVIKNLQAADWVCSTSVTMAEQTRRLCPSVKNLTVTPFGIDIEVFSPRRELKDPSVITVGTVKKLAPKYGVDVLIRAFSLAREKLRKHDTASAERLRLLIVGDGPQRMELEYLTKKLGIDSVTTFVGQVPHRDVPDYLNRLDVYVAVSRLDSESFGVAVLEASACGLPVVVSDAGGLPEVVKHGITGYVVERDNVEATADAIMRLVENPSLRNQMGDAGRQHTKTNYNWTDSVSIMEAVYAKVTKHFGRY
ncbi:MAG: glycosyltransferase [Moorellaceae bacterium]